VEKTKASVARVAPRTLAIGEAENWKASAEAAAESAMRAVVRILMFVYKCEVLCLLNDDD